MEVSKEMVRDAMREAGTPERWVKDTLTFNEFEKFASELVAKLVKKPLQPKPETIDLENLPEESIVVGMKWNKYGILVKRWVDDVSTWKNLGNFLYEFTHFSVITPPKTEFPKCPYCESRMEPMASHDFNPTLWRMCCNNETCYSEGPYRESKQEAIGAVRKIGES